MIVSLVRQCWKLVAVALLSLLMATCAEASSSIPSSSSLGTTISRDSQVGADTETQVQPEETTSSDVVARFYLIRHGETLANIEGLVLGQTNSPLSAQGERQARLLGQTDMILTQDFWRKYTSDLGRARQTTNLILGEDRSLEDLGVQLEPRLREVAKGVREMYPKSLNYEQATERFIKEHGPDEPFPLLESEDEVMARVYQWMFQVVRDVIQEYRQERKEQDGNKGETRPRVYPIFAVSHSATLRALIGRLVRDDLPTTIDFSPVGRDGASKGHMQIPNTSVTIIDICPRNIDDELWDPERTSQVPVNPSFLWDAKLKTLTWTPNYDDA